MSAMRNRVTRTALVFRTAVVLCVLLVPLSVQAVQVDEQDVAAAVETWVRHVTADARPDAVIERMEPYIVDGRTVGYIAHLARGGYCLCGADDLVLPVYLYSPQGTYDAQNPNNEYILWEIAARLANLQQALADEAPELEPYRAALAERAAFWRDLAARRIPERTGGRGQGGEPEKIVLPLTCTWWQGYPYNEQCPDLPPGSGDRTYVGCVATAMAQIMYYWQWPWTGQDEKEDHTYPYYWRDGWDEEPCGNDPGINPGKWAGRLEWRAKPTRVLRMNGWWDWSIYSKAEGISDEPGYLSALEELYGRLTPEEKECNVDFGATTYDWSIMEDDHYDPPDAGDAEVAELCYHVGVSLEMKWGLWASGAKLRDVPGAIEQYFRYDPDATFDSLDISTMTEEITWLRPLEMAGICSLCGAAHAWVVYGYNKATDPDREFLMNMGMYGGGGNGWYSCDHIDPGGHLFINQHHVTRIAPLSVVRFVGGSELGDGSPSDPYADLNEALGDVSDNTTLIIEAGSTEYLDTPIIDRPLILKGYKSKIRGS